MSKQQISPSDRPADIFWSSPDDALLDREVIASVVGYSTRWLRTLANEGRGPKCIRLPGRMLYQKRAVLEWLATFENGGGK